MRSRFWFKYLALDLNRAMSEKDFFDILGVKVDISETSSYERYTEEKTKVSSSLRETYKQNKDYSPSVKNSSGKRHRAIRSKRKKAALDKSLLLEELKKSCGCMLQCNTIFDVNDIMYWRYKVHCLTEGEERMKKIIEILKLASSNLSKHQKNQLYMVNQKLCCRSFFVNVVLKVSVSTLGRARQASIAGKDNVYQTTPGSLTHAARGKICEGFIRQYMDAACDRDPTGAVYRMPIGISKTDLHALYKVVHKDGVEKSEFHKILTTKFKNLIFSQSQRFTKCTACHNFRCLIEKEKDPSAKSDLIAKRNLHLKEQQIERDAYYVRRAQAEMRPKAILSVILDGMDQNKSDLPHYALWNAPSGSGQMKLKTHIMGSLVHGRGKYFFVDHREIPHDTNLSLSCLLKILQQEAEDGVLPPTLYVQLDNTTRENKNRYFLGMMAYLVKKGFVREVYLSFLLVGHTHEDVDQSFSKISQKLKITDALTSHELLSVIRQSHTPQPKVQEIGTVWDIKSWLEGSINKVHNVTFPHIYRIFKDEKGHVTLRYKQTSTEDEWHPRISEAQLEIFKVDASGQQIIPADTPKAVNPAMDNVYLRDLERSIQKDYQLAKFTAEIKLWWEDFFANPLKTSKERWPKFKQAQPIPSTSSLSEEEMEVVRKFMEKRELFKEVFTRGQNRNK